MVVQSQAAKRLSIRITGYFLTGPVFDVCRQSYKFCLAICLQYLGNTYSAFRNSELSTGMNVEWKNMSNRDVVILSAEILIYPRIRRYILHTQSDMYIIHIQNLGLSRRSSSLLRPCIGKWAYELVKGTCLESGVALFLCAHRRQHRNLKYYNNRIRTCHWAYDIRWSHWQRGYTHFYISPHACWW